MAPSTKRLALSVFLIGHVSAVVLANMPECPLRAKLSHVWVDAYLAPTGLWQYWGMFAPEPCKDTLTLEAVVRDSRGLVRHYAFPRMMDQSAWTGFRGGYRHSKYASNVGATSGKVNREFAARFVVRALKLREEDFPADVQLVYQVWPSIPHDADPDDPPPSPWQSVIETYTFPNLAETMP